MNTATYPFEKTDARTGNLASSVRIIPIASVQFFVPEKYLEIPWYHHKTGELICGFPLENLGSLPLKVSVSRVRDFCFTRHVGP